MGIKVEVNKSGEEEERITYPFIGFRDAAVDGILIVLFVSYGNGIVIRDGRRIPDFLKDLEELPYKVGYSALWNMDSFKKFEGKVTIKNAQIEPEVARADGEEGRLTYPFIGEQISSKPKDAEPLIVVLFWSDGVGIVLESNAQAYSFGHFDTNWDMRAFKKLKGSVTLTNN